MEPWPSQGVALGVLLVLAAGWTFAPAISRLLAHLMGRDPAPPQSDARGQRLVEYALALTLLAAVAAGLWTRSVGRWPPNWALIHSIAWPNADTPADRSASLPGGANP